MTAPSVRRIINSGAPIARWFSWKRSYVIVTCEKHIKIAYSTTVSIGCTKIR